jgi:1-acyl-sn-glycerol-3-phosphate acyltransferase
MSLFYWITRSLFKLLFFICYRHRVIGLENVPKGAAIIAPNHVSFYDPPLVAVSMPEEVYFLAKEALFKSRVLGFFLRSLNTYPVRGSASDLASFKILCQLLNEGKKVTVFPEGVRSKSGELLPLQQGVAMLAMRCQCPIVPTYIKGAYEVYPRFRKFPRLWGRTVCIFGKPLYPQEYAHLDKKGAQQAMTRDLGEELKELGKSRAEK